MPLINDSLAASSAKLLYEQREFFTTPVRAFFIVKAHGMGDRKHYFPHDVE